LVNTKTQRHKERKGRRLRGYLTGITDMVLETGFFRESVGPGEGFSLKHPVSLVQCVIPRRKISI